MAATHKLWLGLAMLGCAALLSGCGFKPIYAAASDSSGGLVNRQIGIGFVNAAEDIQPVIVSALKERMPLENGVAPKYELRMVATERADRLAVQIDATVTRYNYRLSGRYSLRDLDTGKVITGSATAATSYNIVSSQYSTLFAERSAQEKAARLLVEKIELDLLMRFAQKDDLEASAGEALELQLDEERDFITDDDQDTLDIIPNQ